jgi:hypothetical protein
MSISTYAELRTELLNFIDDTDVDTTDAATLITLAEARIAKEVRHRHMEKALSGTISSGVLTVPSDYVELKHAYISRTPVVPLKRKSAEWIYANYPTRSADGVPLYLAREAGNFIFGPYPDDGYTVAGVYYYRLSALSSAVNSLFTDHPDLYLFAALAEAEPFIGRDARIALWEAKYERIKNAVMREDRAEAFSGGPLQITPA